MTAEKINRSKGKYAIQDNFFHLVDVPDLETNSFPSRSRNCFWQGDILPVAHLLRKIYIAHGVSEEEEKMLDEVWQWTQEGNRFELPNSRRMIKAKDLREVPLAVVMNKLTADFFGMRDVFKVPSSRDMFEAFVGWMPGTRDFENDVRRITFPIVHKYRTRPLEMDRNALQASRASKMVYSQDAIGLLGVGEDELERFETIDAVTYILLFNYHMALYRREQAILKINGLL